jgi:galactokinase
MANGTVPMYTVHAPGRVNLIGEHTDYTGGDVLPIATDLRTTLTAEPAADVRIRSRTLDASGRFDPDDFGADGTWVDYVKGVYHVLGADGHDPGGFHGEIRSSLPLGSGLSSSASLELAVLAVLDEAYDLGLSRRELALLGQRVENDYVGVACGIMDQFAVALCEAGHALHIDTASLEYEAVPIPESMRVVVFHTGVERGLADTAYNERRATVEAALDRLGRETSKDVTAADLGTLPERQRRRVGYLRRENRRVDAATDALADGDLDGFGDLLTTAHRDIAGNYGASCEELDFVVRTAVEAGAHGARLTGAGWGGAAVAIADAETATSIAREVAAAYAERYPDHDAEWFLIEPSGGVAVEQEE